MISVKAYSPIECNGEAHYTGTHTCISFSLLANVSVNEQIFRILTWMLAQDKSLLRKLSPYRQWFVAF